MAGRPMWEIELRHDGLNKYRHIKGTDKYIVEQKAAAQQFAWDEMWERKVAAEEKRIAREAAIQNKEDKKELAFSRTEDRQQELEDLENTLQHTLQIDDAIDWESLKNKNNFPEKKPTPPKHKPFPHEPKRNQIKYQPTLGFFDRIIGSLRKKKEAIADKALTYDHNSWTKKVKQIEEDNTRLDANFSKRVKKWEIRKENYEKDQKSLNEKVDIKKEQYLSCEVDAIIDYCDMVLANSAYPDYFPQEWDMEYQPDPKILIVEYTLPDISVIPTTKTVKYIASRDEFTETNISNAALNKLYDNLLYQISLRTIHELYEADTIEAIDSIVFNGFVDSVSASTGQDTHTCIMSVQTSKEEFLAINLEKVEPKACFKKLKGVGSYKLHSIAAVAPILNIDKEDRRFVSAYNVVDGIDDTDNLAAMDWQDFENLIREIFQKEFMISGGEVKITQASRDGGVDAIAFDPDPIRGGKLVIQAKRYTNVVGVSAVRDLYGTTVNEGATKGILVTTADFGPDAYEFSKGKPLTLMNGGNLLNLLEKHGHKAKIDIQEAKKKLGQIP